MLIEKRCKFISKFLHANVFVKKNFVSKIQKTCFFLKNEANFRYKMLKYNKMQLEVLKNLQLLKIANKPPSFIKSKKNHEKTTEKHSKISGTGSA